MANIEIGLVNSNNNINKYNKSYIKSIESTTQSTTNPSTIEYGILANTGRVEIRDLDGQIRSDIESGVLPISNVDTAIVVNGKQIQRHITNDSDYTEKDNLLILPLTNKLAFLDNISYKGYAISDTPKTAKEMFYHICDSVGIDRAGVIIKPNASIILDSIIIKHPYIKPCSARVALNKICEIAQLQMFADEDDNLCIISTNNSDSVEINDTYTIPTYYKITNLDRTIVLKNKYDAIDMRETRVYPKKDIAVSVYSWNSLDNQTSITSTYNANGYNTDVYVRVKYWTFTVTIPKKSNENKETIDRILTGVNSDGEPNIRWVITGTHQEGTVRPVYSEDGSINYIYSYGEEKQWSGKIETFSLEYLNKSASVQDLTNVKTAQVVDEGTSFSITLTIAVENEYYYYDMVGTPNGGVANLYKPQKLEVTLMGDKTTITFEDVDVSSANIASAKNPVTIPHNELLQSDATWDNAKLSTKIKNNVLGDYAGGIPTGNIELFCGNLQGTNGKSKNWANGQLLNIDDVIKFEDDKENESWRITGRTFTYNASPKISLELKRLNKASWKTVWTGSFMLEQPVLTDVEEGEDGGYHAVARTYISLQDVNVDKRYPIRISGWVEDYVRREDYDYTHSITTQEQIVHSGAWQDEIVSCRIDLEDNEMVFTTDIRKPTPNLRVEPSYGVNITKIEQYY